MWLAVTTLCLIATVGCENENENKTPDTPQGPAKFTLEKTLVEVPSEGGDFSVSYTIDNPVANGIVTAVAKNNWIKLTEYANGAVVFTVSANESMTDRETAIDVVYSGVEERQTIIVYQEAIEGELFDVTITSESTKLVVDVKPLDKTATYMCRIMKKEIVDAYELTSDSALFNADLQFMREEASNDNQSLSHYARAIALTGDTEDYEFTGLTPNTEYVVFCYYINLDSMGHEGEIYRENIRTAEPPLADVTFDLELTVDGIYINEKITPSDNSICYYHGYMVLDEFYTWYGSDASFEESFEAKWNNVVLVQSSWGKSISQIVADNCVTGTYEQRHEMSARTEYVFFVVAVDSKTGFVASVPTCKTIKTESANAVDLTVDITVSDITSNGAIITFTPSNYTNTYGCHVVSKDEWLGFGETDDQRIYSITSRYTLYERNEVFQYTASNLSPSTEYVAFAFGLANENPTTGLFIKEFSTL